MISLYAYRDILRSPDEQYSSSDDKTPYGRHTRPGYGVTLYFAEGDIVNAQRRISDSFSITHIFDLASAIATIISGKGRSEAARGIQAWMNRNDPIVQFFRMCIDSGTGSSRCLSLAKQAGYKYRRQNALGLYNVLKLEREFQIAEPQPEQPKPTVEPPYDLYAAVQDHFADQFENDEYFQQFDYQRSDLSAAGIDEVDVDLEPGDFVFEVGELESARFKYWGHYHAETRKFGPLHMYSGFDMQLLFRLLRR